jgi:phage major head subunit gpT-like protein
MKINSGNLKTLKTAFSAAFAGGLGMAAPGHERIATKITSTTGKNEYGWLGKLPSMREWLGDRVINNISQSDYAIKNKPYENTIGVDRDDVEDDNLGIYTPLFQEMGMETRAFPSVLVFDALRNGNQTVCYDGQYFFDTDHPVLDANGNVTSVSNYQDGPGDPWFLLSTKRAIKPIIHQERRAFDFVAMDNPDDPNVFHKKEFLYGVDGRMNVGYGFWQFAYCSRQPLTAANYAAARAAMMSLKRDGGRPLGIRPDLLLVSPNNDEQGRRIVINQTDAAGAANPFVNTADLETSSWLA